MHVLSLDDHHTQQRWYGHSEFIDDGKFNHKRVASTHGKTDTVQSGDH